MSVIWNWTQYLLTPREIMDASEIWVSEEITATFADQEFYRAFFDPGHDGESSVAIYHQLRWKVNTDDTTGRTFTWEVQIKESGGSWVTLDSGAESGVKDILPALIDSNGVFETPQDMPAEIRLLGTVAAGTADWYVESVLAERSAMQGIGTIS